MNPERIIPGQESLHYYHELSPRMLRRRGSDRDEGGRRAATRCSTLDADTGATGVKFRAEDLPTEGTSLIETPEPQTLNSDVGPYSIASMIQDASFTLSLIGVSEYDDHVDVATGVKLRAGNLPTEGTSLRETPEPQTDNSGVGTDSSARMTHDSPTTQSLVGVSEYNQHAKSPAIFFAQPPVAAMANVSHSGEGYEIDHGLAAKIEGNDRVLGAASKSLNHTGTIVTQEKNDECNNEREPNGERTMQLSATDGMTNSDCRLKKRRSHFAGIEDVGSDKRNNDKRAKKRRSESIVRSKVDCALRVLKCDPDADSIAGGNGGEPSGVSGEETTPRRSHGLYNRNNNVKVEACSYDPDPDSVQHHPITLQPKGASRESESIIVSAEKLAVYGMGSKEGGRGNSEYVRMQRSYRAEYIRSGTPQKEVIVDLFINKFDFCKQSPEGTWQSMIIVQAKEKVRKALADFRLLGGPSHWESLTGHERSDDHAKEKPRRRSRKSSTLNTTAEVEACSAVSDPDYRQRRSHTSHVKDTSRELLKSNCGSGEKLVVYGVGREGMAKEPGNIEYLQMLRTYISEYQRSDKPRQEAIVDMFIKNFDYRRLIKNKWQLMKSEEARGKVVKAIADPRKNPTLRRDESTVAQLGALALRRKSPYLHMFLDKGTPYIEELSFHFYAMRNPEDLKPGKLEPLPLPSPFLLPPSDDLVKWSYDDSSRVVLVDFSDVNEIPERHKRFLGHLMERDDITVVCEGLFGFLKKEKEFLESVEHAFGDDPYHRFRQFDRVEEDGQVSYKEHDGYVSMKVSDYLSYLAILRGEWDLATRQRSFSYDDATGSRQTIIDAFDVVYYMIDVDMPKLLHHMDEEYKQNFKMKEILPGGAWCMMNHLPTQARPFMGPNCYISPGGGFTQVHQDGHGTVDSGHSNFSGYNEVVMLRRLPECHKLNACSMVPAFEGGRSKDQAMNMLYRLPHDDRDDKPKWPTTTTIEGWKELNYCPSVFILKPGQHVLINKGRLHSFRKMTFDQLPKDDCHAQLRPQLILALKERKMDFSPLCISVAYDWMFMGFSAEGINREVSSTLECASLCRKHKTSKSLAIPETAIFKLASGIPSRKNQRCYQKPLFSVPAAAYNELRPTWKDIARGILPSLRYVVKRDCHKQWDGCESTKHRRDQGVLLHVDKVPDSHCDAFEHPIDPFGNDYFCKLCDQELSNSYFHCNGCEKLLAKDFNICSQCFEEREFLQNINMSKVTTTAMASNFHHMGKNLGKCTCQRPGACLECQKCMICTCNCHKVFYKRFRFYTEWRQEELLEYCGELVGDDEIQFARETECRLNGEGMVPESDDVVQPHRAQCRLQSVLELRLERVSAMMPAGSGDQTDAENSDRKLLAAYEYVTRRPTLVPDVNGQKRGSCVQDVVVNSRDHGQGQQHY